MLSQSAQQVWKSYFTNWPEGVPRRGVLVSTLNEATPFKGFMVQGELLLLERVNPDPLGARFNLMSYEAINCVKLTDPLKESVFTAAGFTGKLSGT
jgi:hypothetical protein